MWRHTSPLLVLILFLNYSFIITPPNLKAPPPSYRPIYLLTKKKYPYQYLYIAKWTFCAQQFFSAKNSKVTTIKTKSATIAFFRLLLSFSSLFLLSYSFVTLIFRASRAKETCLLTFVLKWQSLQMSLGWFSKNWFDRYPAIRPRNLVLDYCSLLLQVCERQR